jgi:probable rRNA maturation factor
MNIVIINRQRARKINLGLLKKITGDLLVDLDIQNADLGINLVATPEMTSLNETFLQHEGSTDVITFDYTEKRKAESGKRKLLHGELFVCVDEAIVQAKKFKTGWESETVRYIVHGVLHLLGHDDSRPPARRRMKREENRRLRALSRRFSLAQLGRAVKLSG